MIVRGTARRRLAWVLVAALAGCFLPAAAAARDANAIPELDRWEAQMLKFGRATCDYLLQPHDGETLLASVYYDAQRVFFQIADYTRNPAWNICAQRAGTIYREYVLTNGGKVPGYWNFTKGLAMDALRNGGAESKRAILLLATNAAFAPDGTPAAWTADAALSREVAYTIRAYLDAERMGAARRPRLRALVDQALAHIQQWCRPTGSVYVQPFMVGLTLEALIAYHEQTKDSRIPPAVRTALDWLWLHAWVPKDQAFWYESKDPTSGAPDLNLLIAPAYAWLYRHTGEPVWRDRGDQVFAGGVKGAYLGRGKQFNQNYRWSFDYAKWRNGKPEDVGTRADGSRRRQER